jgi:hypothetical protein
LLILKTLYKDLVIPLIYLHFPDNTLIAYILFSHTMELFSSFIPKSYSFQLFLKIFIFLKYSDLFLRVIILIL